MNTTTAPALAPAEAPALPVSNLYQRRILAALNIARYPRLTGPGKLSYGHIFEGIDPAEKARRRAKGKAQRAARKAAR